jgi:hypothetical protein
MGPMRQPLTSLAGGEGLLSPQRLAAYRLPTDIDPTHGLARYLWNIALAAAMQPALHVLEVAFRNELSRAASSIINRTDKRQYGTDGISSWMDAKPTMLLDHEVRKVAKAKRLLGRDPKSQTEGHLIAKLDFGFWVALCRDPYADTRSEGPRLWPRALSISFQRRPSHANTRAAIFHRFDPIREYRNTIAHHEPIWDRRYLYHHDDVIDAIGWMSPQLADSVRATSRAGRVFAAGPESFRSEAEQILGTGA